MRSRQVAKSGCRGSEKAESGAPVLSDFDHQAGLEFRRQKPGEIGRCRAWLEQLFRKRSGKRGMRFLRQEKAVSLRCDGQRPLAVGGVDMDRERAAANQPLGGDEREIEGELEQGLVHSGGGTCPVEADLAVVQQAEESLSSFLGVDIAAKAGGAAEGEAEELQPRRTLFRALAEEGENLRAHFGIVILVEDLDAVGQRTNRADEIVTQARAQHRGEPGRGHEHCSLDRPPKGSGPILRFFLLHDRGKSFNTPATAKKKTDWKGTRRMDSAYLLPPLITAVADAGREIMDVAEHRIAVREKADRSPVTEADERAEWVILKALRVLTPGIPVIAEERVAKSGLPDVNDGPFWLVDPLDGTKEFLRGGDDFTVNIALVEKRQPSLGIVYCPKDGRLFVGRAGEGAWQATLDREGQLGERQDMRTRRAATPLRIVASRSHRNAETDAYLAHYPDAELVSIGSSLKFCLVAAGEADLYPRLGPTMEWDTAAGHAVLLAAGGRMVDAAGAPFSYFKPDFRNGHFLAWGDPGFTPVPLGDAAGGENHE